MSEINDTTFALASESSGGYFVAATQIETDSGRKPIKSVSIGDMVLTHSGRYRPVISVHSRIHRAGFATVHFGRKQRMDNRISSTPDLPVLVERGAGRAWRAIRDVEVGDSVFVASKRCAVTDELIPFWMNLSRNANPMDLPGVREKLSATKGGFKRKRGGSKGQSHLATDILPFCEKMTAEGWRMVPVGAGVIPDAIGIKDGKIVAFEVEKTNGNYLAFKKEKYEGSPITNYVDEVRWIDARKPRADQPRAWYEADEETGFCKSSVIAVTSKDRYNSYKSVVTVYGFTVEDDNSFVASHVVARNA